MATVKFTAEVDNSKLKSGISQTENVLDGLKNATKKAASEGGASIENVSRQMRELSKTIVDATAQYEQLSAIDKQGSLGKGLQENIANAKRQLEQLQSVKNSALGVKGTSVINGKELTIGEQAANKLTKAVKVAQGGVSGLIGTLSELGPYGIAAGAVAGGVMAIGTKAVKSAENIESMDYELSVLLGSMDKAQQMRKQLQSYAGNTTYSTGQLVGDATTLKKYGVTTQNIVPILQQLGDVAMGSADKLEALSRAYGLMNNTGKVSSRTMRQFAAAGLSSQAVADAMGISVATFNERLSKSQISIDEFNGALQKVTSEGGQFYQAAINRANTLQGVTDNIGKAINGIFAQIGQTLLEPIKNVAIGLLAVLREVSTVISALVSDTDTASNAFGGFGDVINTVREAFHEIFGAIGSVVQVIVQYLQMVIPAITHSQAFHDVLEILGNAFHVVGTVIRIVAKIIQTLIGAFKYAYQSSTAFRIGILALTAPLRATIAFVKQLVGWIEDLVDSIADLLGIEGKAAKRAPKPSNSNSNTNTNNSVIPVNIGGGSVKTPKVKTPKVKTPKVSTTKVGKTTETPEQALAKAEKDYKEKAAEAQIKLNKGLITEDKYYSTLLSAYQSVIDAKIKANKLDQQSINYYKELEKNSDIYSITYQNNKKVSVELQKFNDGLSDGISYYKALEEAAEEYYKAIVERGGDATDALNSLKTAQQNLKEAEAEKDINDTLANIDKNTGSTTNGNDYESKLNTLQDNLKTLTDLQTKYKDTISDTSIEYQELTKKIKATQDEIKTYQKAQANLNAENQYGGSVTQVVGQYKELADTLNSGASPVIKMAAALSQMGQSMQQLGGDSALAKIGLVAAAVGQIILGFAEAAEIAAKTTGPWGFLAYIGAGLGALAATISTIESFSTGGIVKGQDRLGDHVPIMAEGGEMVLNNRQQAHLFEMLNNGTTSSNGQMEITSVKVKGSDIYLALSNYSKIKRKTGKITGIN